MRPGGVAGLGVVVGLGLGLASPLAQASNETHQRTPVVWDGEATCGVDDEDVVCGLVIDRSQQSTWHVPYGIPFEDTDVGEDEVVDSRRHQFFALCRQPAPALERPPTWVSAADVTAAGEVVVCTTPMDEGPEECGPLVDPDSVDPEDVLETSSDWAGCWQRITADDARRPITCAMAEEGVDWSLASVPAGVWVLHGYTWEPALNLWSPRPGFLKIVDDPDDPLQDRPAAALLALEGDGIVHSGEPIILDGCADALPGSTLRAEWAMLPNGPGEPTWNLFVEDLQIEDGALELELQLPSEADGSFVLVRATVTDPMQRTYTAYLPRELGVLPGDDCPEEGGGIVADPNCPENGDESGADGTSATGETGAHEAEGGHAGADAGGGGCACTSAPARGSGARAGLLLVLVGVARRRARAVTA